MTKKFNFNATGRKLFESEKWAVEFFNYKYGPDYVPATQAQIDEHREMIRIAILNGKPYDSLFYKQLQDYKASKLSA